MILESESESNILDAFAETLGFAVEAFFPQMPSHRTAEGRYRE